MRPFQLVLSSFALLLAVSTGTSAPSLPAATLVASSQGAGNAAAVVIADPGGGEPKTVCVRFSETSITGKQLLDRATQQRPDIDPVYARFGSRGHAVCALCGTGCDASDCFCQSRYWNYNVARDGGWTRSGVGVDHRVVEHGDVDGWAFGGDGAAPPYLSFETVCGVSADPSPEPSPGPTPSSASPTTGPRATSPPATSSPGPSPAGTPPPTRTPITSPTPITGPTPTDDVGTTPTLTPADEPTSINQPTAADDTPADAPGRTPTETSDGPLVFLAVLAGLLGIALWRRR